MKQICSFHFCSKCKSSRAALPSEALAKEGPARRIVLFLNTELPGVTRSFTESIALSLRLSVTLPLSLYESLILYPALRSTLYTLRSLLHAPLLLQPI